MSAGRGAARALFAGVLLIIGATLNVMYGIAAISNSHFFVRDTHYVIGDLKTWGWVALILGVVEAAAAFSLFAGHAFGRWFGIGAGAICAVDALLELPAQPIWSLCVFGLSLYVIHGLALYRPDESDMWDQPISSDQPLMSSSTTTTTPPGAPH